MEFTVLSVLELHPQSPTAAMLKLGIVVCAYITSILMIFIKTRNKNIVIMVPYPQLTYNSLRPN